MRFFNEIYSGISVEVVAELAVDELFRSLYLADGRPIIELSHEFSSQCLEAAELVFEMNLDTFRDKKARENFDWLAANTMYVWSANMFRMARLEAYLSMLAKELYMLECQLRYRNLEGKYTARINALQATEHGRGIDISEKSKQPVRVFKYMIMDFCSLIQRIFNVGTFSKRSLRYYREPLALISFYMLQSIVRLYRERKGLFSYLRLTMGPLLSSAWHITRYKILITKFGFELMQYIVEFPALILAKKPEHSSAPAIAYTLGCRGKHTLKVKVCHLLTNTMRCLASTSRRLEASHLRTMTEYLTMPHMHIIFSRLLKKCNNMRVINALIPLLSELQSHLQSVEFFGANMLGKLIEVAFNATSLPVQNNAAKLYIELIKRQCNDETIILHFFDSVNKSEYFGRYLKTKSLRYKLLQTVKIFKRYFEPIGKLYMHKNIVINVNVRVELRIYALNMLFSLMQLQLNSTNQATEEFAALVNVIENIRLLFDDLNNLELIALAADGLASLDFANCTNLSTTGKRVIGHLEDCICELFCVEDNTILVFLSNLAKCLLKCISVTRNTSRRDNLQQFLMQQFQIQHLKAIEELNVEQPNNRNMSSLSSLKCFVTLEKIEMLDMECPSFYEMISTAFLPFVERCSPELDFYSPICIEALHAFILAAIRLYEHSNSDRDLILSRNFRTVTAIFGRILRNMGDYTIDQIAKAIKSIALIQLICAANCPLKRINYDAMIDCMAQMLSSSELAKEHSKIVLTALYHFRLMHSARNFEPTSGMIWRVLLNYKTKFHFYDDELQKLLICCLKFYSELFKEVLAIIITFLYLDDLPQKTIDSAVHQLIEDIQVHKGPDFTWQLRLHTIQRCLQYPMDSVIESTGNRLKLLNTVFNIIKPMCLTASEFRKIRKKAQAIPGNIEMNSVEKRRFKNFMNQLDTHCRRCITNSAGLEKQPKSCNAFLIGDICPSFYVKE